jgi:starch synthase (maltosyl-transferring)
VELCRDLEPETRVQLALDEGVAALVARYPDRSRARRYERELRVTVDPPRARFSAWYEMFPRSAAAEPGKHGTFADCEARLPYIAEMGFDVLYLPPIHPIGRTHRKGRNNATTARPGDVGSPWAIGAEEGGHKSVHPLLGTLEDFRRLVARARERGIEVALDIAYQCSPDHPYVGKHPEWFRRRPDGSVQYAENPPKKYQDIYPFDFDTPAWRSLWEEFEGVVRFWIEQGVLTFRVDNPHTKALPFWEWLIQRIKRDHPEAIFLSEAFTRPKVMYALAKLGFTQSYTYFAWRNTKPELTQYFTELAQAPVREFFRPSLWPNTPDILTEYLQLGGRAAFMARLVLAATLGASYGIYGPAFELCENSPREPGSEEYLDSEKYQLRRWEIEREDSLKELIARVNRIRRENPALQSDRSLRFHTVDNEELICYSKSSAGGADIIFIVVNLDPHHTQSGWVELPFDELGIDPDLPYQVHDLLGGARYLWHGRRNYVELDPRVVPAHIFRLRRRLRTEQDFEYYL